jgi:hypothetical protein
VLLSPVLSAMASLYLAPSRIKYLPLVACLIADQGQNDRHHLLTLRSSSSKTGLLVCGSNGSTSGGWVPRCRYRISIYRFTAGSSLICSGACGYWIVASVSCGVLGVDERVAVAEDRISVQSSAQSPVMSPVRSPLPPWPAISNVKSVSYFLRGLLLTR